MNHIYTTFQKYPNYSITVEYYNIHPPNYTFHTLATCPGGCQFTITWNPLAVSGVEYHINTGTQVRDEIFPSSSTNYDRCILVKTGGIVAYRGDNSTGCNSSTS